EGARRRQCSFGFSARAGGRRLQSGGAHQSRTIRRGGAVRPRRRHHPGNGRAAHEPVRNAVEGAARAGTVLGSRTQGDAAVSNAAVASHRGKCRPGSDGKADLRTCAAREGALGLDHLLVQTILGYSLSASSRLTRMAGTATTTKSPAANTRNAKLIGSCRKTIVSPREIRRARRRFSSIIGPSTKPRMSGAGSHSNLSAT